MAVKIIDIFLLYANWRLCPFTYLLVTEQIYRVVVIYFAHKCCDVCCSTGMIHWLTEVLLVYGHIFIIMTSTVSCGIQRWRGMIGKISHMGWQFNKYENRICGLVKATEYWFDCFIDDHYPLFLLPSTWRCRIPIWCRFKVRLITRGSSGLIFLLQ